MNSFDQLVVMIILALAFYLFFVAMLAL